MPKERRIVDIHVHLFNGIHGQKGDGETSSAGFGRVKTKTGMIQFMPPFSKETAFPVELILEWMDCAGVSQAVLVQNPLIGTVNQEIAEAIERYPHRFIGSIQVDPMDPGAVETIKKYAVNPKHNILKFEISDGWGWSGIHSGLKLDGDYFKPIWELASEMKLPVILDAGRPNNAGYQLDAIDRITTEYSDVLWILEHLGGMNQENLHLKDKWQRMIEFGKKTNVYLGMAAIGAGLREDYPCYQALGLLNESVKKVGADKILWGSDIPGTLKNYTYQQMIEMVSVHATFLSEKEKDLILGENALRILKGLTS
ncbi:MAG TPA: amidohydrolase family protein [Bacillota bacterium]|nr:amidohydrolase family protein [Bacillota bacterium]